MADLKFSQFTAQTTIASGDKIAGLKSGANSIWDVDVVRGYKAYTASFTQSGSTDPTVVVYLNSVGSIVWTRSSTGTYSGTLAGAFPAGKFPKMEGFIRNGSNIGSVILNTFQVIRVSNDVIAIGTTQNGTLTDGLLNIQLLEIKVYL